MAVPEKAKINGIDTVVYLVKDVERATRFYEDLLDMKASERFSQGAEFTLTDDSTFGLWKLPGEEFYPTGGVHFNVRDIHAAVTHYKSKGIHFDGEIIESPVCYIAIAQDSEGNHFLLHQMK